MNALRQVHTLGRINFAIPIVLLGSVFLKVGDVARQRICSVIDQVFSQLALFSVYLGIGRNVHRIDDGQVQSRFDGVIEKHAIEHSPRVLLQAKRDIADPQDGQYTGELSPGAGDGFQCFDGGRFKLLLSGRHRKCEHVENQRIRRQPILVDTDIVDFVGNLDLAFRCLAHAYLVNGQRDHGGTMFNRHRHNVVYALSSRLHIDRVDDCPPWISF